MRVRVAAVPFSNLVFLHLFSRSVEHSGWARDTARTARPRACRSDPGLGRPCLPLRASTIHSAGSDRSSNDDASDPVNAGVQGWSRDLRTTGDSDGFNGGKLPPKVPPTPMRCHAGAVKVSVDPRLKALQDVDVAGSLPSWPGHGPGPGPEPWHVDSDSKGIDGGLWLDSMPEWPRSQRLLYTMLQKPLYPDTHF